MRSKCNLAETKIIPGMYIDKNYQMHFQIVYPNTFRIVVKQLLRTEENGYRDVSYYSLNQFIKPIGDMKQLKPTLSAHK